MVRYKDKSREFSVLRELYITNGGSTPKALKTMRSQGYHISNELAYGFTKGIREIAKDRQKQWGGETVKGRLNPIPTKEIYKQRYKVLAQFRMLVVEAYSPNGRYKKGDVRIFTYSYASSYIPTREAVVERIMKQWRINHQTLLTPPIDQLIKEGKLEEDSELYRYRLLPPIFVTLEEGRNRTQF